MNTICLNQAAVFWGCLFQQPRVRLSEDKAILPTAGKDPFPWRLANNWRFNQRMLEVSGTARDASLCSPSTAQIPGAAFKAALRLASLPFSVNFPAAALPPEACQVPHILEHSLLAAAVRRLPSTPSHLITLTFEGQRLTV